jgi:hypothetical protein
MGENILRSLRQLGETKQDPAALVPFRRGCRLPLGLQTLRQREGRESKFRLKETKLACDTGSNKGGK